MNHSDIVLKWLEMIHWAAINVETISIASFQILELGDVSYAADIWGLGVLWYQLITKTKPYREVKHKTLAQARHTVSFWLFDDSVVHTVSMLAVQYNCLRGFNAHTLSIVHFLLFRFVQTVSHQIPQLAIHRILLSSAVAGILTIALLWNTWRNL